MANNEKHIPLSTRLISLLLALYLTCSCFAGFPVTATGPEPESVPETTAVTVAETTSAAVPETTSATTPEIQPDPNADLETAANWEATLPQTLSGKWGEDLLAVASSQLGYRESKLNYILDADGVTHSGYNRYGAWYGSFTMDDEQAYRPWNITFLFFSIYYSGITDFPLEETCPEWIDSLDYYELFCTPAEYTPAAGDLIFTDSDGDGEADRVGIVSQISETEVTAIEGDADGAVAAIDYSLTEENPETPVILGYADMAKAMADAIPENSDIAMLPSLSAGSKLYLDLTGFTGWENDGARFLLYYHDSSNGEHKTFLSKAADHLYYVELPSNLDNSKIIRLCRVAASGDAGNVAWWNATDNLTLPTDGKNCYKISGWGSTGTGTNNGSWTTYDDGSGSGGGNAATPTVYFSVPADWTNAGYTIKVFVQYGPADSENAIHTMTDTGKVDSQGRKIYSYTFSESSCPYGGFYRMYFQALSGDTWNAEYKALDSTTTWTAASEVDGKHYQPGSGWGAYSPSEGGNSGGTVTGTVVDIKSETFSPVDNVMYVDASFYDYYTDWELDGNNRDRNTAGYSVNNDNWVTFRNFNTALSKYYSNNSVKIPLYVGHFQPVWSNWGYPFAGAGLTLYGFKDGQAYGTTSTDQKYFMSVNNSLMASDSTPTSELYNYAAQGLVSSTLSNGSLMAATKSGGTTVHPLFSASFIEGSSLGDVYENVSFPFTKQELNGNGVEYWVFDSADTTLEMKQDSATGDYFLEDVGHQDWFKNLTSTPGTYGDGYGFFPFNSGSTAGNPNTYNYGFGCRLDIPFRLTEDGQVLDENRNKVDIVFEFSGDDDVWVFIDGQLVLDIGGCHGKVTGNINFASKEAWVSNTKINPGTNNTGSNGSKTTKFTLQGANTDDHTLTMFYMERGMWESNMKITFNFPDENQLEVEKQVDTTGVNPLFRDVFEGQSLFSFRIRNLATHFADVAAMGSSQDPITWDIAGSTLSSYSGNTFSRGTYQGYSNALYWNTQYDDVTSEYRYRRYGVLALPGTVDISNMTKLSFDIYAEDSSGFSLSHMYLQLCDDDISTANLVGASLTAGNADAMGCNGTYLSGKTYGSTDTSGNTWVTVTLDLSKLDVGSSFDRTSVKYLRFGYDYSRNIYIKNIVFHPAAAQSNETGFVTQQYDVASYGSAASGELENAAGAVYTSNLSSSSYVVDSNGMFALQSGETVNFHDQFRRGSYIQLEEILSVQEDALFTTTWTMYENDSPVTSFGSGTTMRNPSSTPDMTDVASTLVTDSRVERVATGSVDGNSQQNAYTTEINPGGFLFRSYQDPDSADLSTKLKVVFTNKVNTASLTITKKDAQAGTSNAIGSNEEFTFVVIFYNVGGLGLESESITTTITLSPGESYTITGIPLNTQYRIYELQLDSDISLDSVSGAHTSFSTASYSGTVNGVSYSGVTTYGVSGTLNSNKAVTFTNVKKPVFSLQLTKQWLDDDGSPLASPPSTIYLRLQYRVKGSSGQWTTHTGFSRVVFTPGYESWTYTFSPLDQYDDYASSSRKELEYRVVEMDSAGNVITDSITINGDDYAVTYGSVSAVSNGVATQTITNQLQSRISISIEKKWAVPTGVATPTTIQIQLQRRTGSANFAAVKTINLKSTDGWKYTFTDLEAKDSSGNAYEYRVVELDSSGNPLIPGTGSVQTTINGGLYQVTSTSAVDSQDSSKTNWVITNTLVPDVTLQITKRSSADPNTVLPGATFVLRKTGLSNAIGQKTTDGTGTITYTGLVEGKYTLTEVEAPNGYSLLAEPIDIHIFRMVDDNGVITYTGSVIGFDDVTLGTISADGTYTLSLDVYNKPTIVMPATGGTHGFEFWILGGLCVTALPLLMLLFFPRRPKGKYLRK